MTHEAMDNVEARILSHFAWNPWFLQIYWPENRGRILQVLRDMIAICPPNNDRHVLDVGCFNGYASAAFALSGYDVTAVDSYEDEQRDSLFETLGRATYRKLNLNAEDVFADWPNAEFDMAFMGEVVEHILNWPLQVLQQIRRILKPGGRLYLTTPNPSTLWNAWRIVTGRYDLWGTAAFATEPKIARGEVISKADIHYREYTRSQLQVLLRASGFDVVTAKYIIPGTRPDEPTIKRWVKAAVRVVFPQGRLISSCQYLTCEKPTLESTGQTTAET